MPVSLVEKSDRQSLPQRPAGTNHYFLQAVTAPLAMSRAGAENHEIAGDEPTRTVVQKSHAVTAAGVKTA